MLLNTCVRLELCACMSIKHIINPIGIVIEACLVGQIAKMMKWAGHLVGMKDEGLLRRSETKKQQGC